MSKKRTKAMRRRELRYKLAKAAEKSSTVQEWLPIPGHENYSISCKGAIKSNKRKKERMLHPFGDRVVLDGTSCSVSSFVAQLFVPNPLNRPYVQHKDYDKRNNHHSNLEWEHTAEHIRRAHRCPVNQYTLQGELIGQYYSIKDASEKTKVSMTSISNTCRGFRNSACGFIWKYAA